MHPWVRHRAGNVRLVSIVLIQQTSQLPVTQSKAIIHLAIKSNVPNSPVFKTG